MFYSLKSKIKSILGYILYGMGFMINHRMLNVLSLYFHNPTYDSFEKVVNWLLKHNYTFISADTLVAFIKGEHKFKSKAVFISFDDGWQSNIALLPIIEKYNIPVTIFIASEPLSSGNYWWEFAKASGGYSKVKKLKTLNETSFVSELGNIKRAVQLERSSMTEDELIEFSAHPLIDIQSHTHSHPILTQLREESLDFELRHSKEVINQIISKEIDKFSYPNGSYTQREKDYVKKYYKCAFSTIQSYPTVGGNLYEIPRIALTDDYWSNLAKIVGTWSLIRRLKQI